MSFPTKETRAHCWAARDKYWSCLNKYAPEHNSSTGEAEPKACVEVRKMYEASCPSQWVKHFDRKRTYEQFKEKLAAGMDPLEQAK